MPQYLVFKSNSYTNQICPYYIDRVSAGSPLPVTDYQDFELDLNEYLIHNPADTFFLRVMTSNMTHFKIYLNDLLLVEKGREPKEGNIVIGKYNNEVIIRQFRKMNGQQVLSEDNDFIIIDNPDDFIIIGIATNVIHSL